MPEMIALQLPIHSPEAETRIYALTVAAGFVPAAKDVIEVCNWPVDDQGRKNSIVTAGVDHRKLTLGGYALVYLEPFMVFATREQIEAAPFNPLRRDWCTEAWGDLEEMLEGAGWHLDQPDAAPA